METFLQIVEKYKVPLSKVAPNSLLNYRQVIKCFLAPSHLVMTLRSGLLDKYDVSSLKYINCAGALLSETTINEAIETLGLKNLQQCKPLTVVFTQSVD